MTTLPHQPQDGALQRDTAIDALRGLAALSVLLFHARGMFWVGFVQTYRQNGLGLNFNAWLGYLSEPFSYGFLGVNLFFVLSGYCIHRRGALMLAKNPQATLDYGAFAARRFWRIYPTYVAALIITALVDAWIAGRQFVPAGEQDNSVFAFIVSLLSLQGYFATYFGDNAVFWTLAIEIHFYLAYPILFHLSKIYGPRKTVLFTLALAVAYIAADKLVGIENHLPYRAVQGPVFIPYWFTWATGFFLAEVEAGRTKDLGEVTWKILMVCGFLIGFPQVFHDAHPELADLFWALFFAGFLRWSLKPQGKDFWSGWLGASLAFVGVMSYSLYAIHNPMLQFFHTLVTPAFHYKFESFLPTIAAVLFVLPCAWLFFQLIEKWSISGFGATRSLRTKEPSRG